MLSHAFTTLNSLIFYWFKFYFKVSMIVLDYLAVSFPDRLAIHIDFARERKRTSSLGFFSWIFLFDELLNHSDLVQ